MKTNIQEPIQKRKGVILLVVLAMLTLLAIIGITFVMYASSLEQISEAVIDEQKADYKPRMDPETALNLILGQLVYDVKDDTFGKASVVRGHSLARNLYGYTSQVFPLDRPFGGSGFSDPNTGLPELSKVNFFGQAFVSGQPNVGYTAPDACHWFLAKTYLDPTTKALKVEEPSFWRNSISSASTGIADQKTFRYRPGVEMANGFPPYPPQSGKYDVINLPGGKVEDSIWIDINSPIQTLPNGKKYKMMVSPLILDLDGRLNLNWAGNRMARNNGTLQHGSHEGWGPWEANLDQLMAAMGLPGQQATVLDTKYGGANRTPEGYTFSGGGSGSSSGGYSPRAHFQVDFNGGVDINPNGATYGLPAFLPGSSAGNYFQSFPYFHPGVFGNWSHIETSANGGGPDYNHPVGYNPSFPGGSNLAFALRDLGPLLLWNSKKDDFTKTQSNTYPVKDALAPHLAAYGNNDRHPFLDMITLHSADFDKPGLAGYFSDRKTQGLLWSDSTTPYPKHTVPSPASGGSPTSEFSTVGLAISDLTRVARINLAQIGADYPAIDPATGLYPVDPATQAQVTLATRSRVLLATKVLDGLCAATGTPDMRATPDLANPQYKAWVWLAQVAVNIVDYVDPDEVMTVLDLSPTAAPGTGRKVYGTELPKVVLNEIYAQVDNSQTDFAKTSGNATDDYTVSVFLELLNPTPSSAPPMATNVNRTNDAFLQVKGGMTTQTVYQMELAKTRPPAMDDPFSSDLSGVINFSTTPHDYNGTPSSISTWKDAANTDTAPITLLPSASNFNAMDAGVDKSKTGEKGFLWIGPKVADNIRDTLDPAFAPLEQSTLRYTWPLGQVAPEATILLRRLANPGLAPDINTNPYVLVDCVTLKKEMIQDARKRTNSGANTPTDIALRKSYGRRQPYAGKDIKDASSGATKDLGAYIESVKTNTGAPLHTFGQLNFTTQPFAYTPSTGTDAETPDWLVHYDRQLVSPAGLLLVSTYRPHELPQKFVNVDPTTKRSTAHQHATAWMDEATGLHRFLEMVQCHGEYFLTQSSSGKPVALLPSGGRMMGRVNLNTMPLDATDPLRPGPVLNALLDASSASHFSTNMVNSLAVSLASARSAGSYITPLNPMSRLGSLYTQGGGISPIPTSDPWSLSYKLQWDPFVEANELPNGAPDPNLSGSVHPLVRLEMLDKILNQSTIRSNVFGIWLTVGFFEVTDSTTLPIKLGGEIGAAAGRQTRYKLFAAVDRTRIKAYESSATGEITQAAINAAVDATTGDYGKLLVPINTNQPFKEPITNNPTNIEPRTGVAVNLLALAQAQPLVLTIDPDTVDEETVEATFFGGQLYAAFRRPHVLGAKIISRGNPGPMKDYKVNDDSDVVFYWTILE